MKILITILLFFISISINGQKSGIYKVLDSKKDSLLTFKSQNLGYYTDESKSLLINDILTKKFDRSLAIPKNYNAFYWYKFKVKVSLKSKYFVFFLSNSDDSDVFIPFKSGYKNYKLGLFVKGEKVRFDLREKIYLSVPIDSIDFSKELYYNKRILTIIGKNQLETLPKILFTNNLEVVDGLFRKKSVVNKVINYTIIFCFSFVLFLISFIITKDKNYINYSFYLFFIIILFGIRIPLIFNFFNSIHPRLFFYLDDLSQIISSIFYFYFIVFFLDFKNNFKRLYYFSKILLISFAVFGLLLIVLNLVFPYAIFKFTVFEAFKIIFTIISLGVFIYLMKQKLATIYRIVLFGSFLLIMGNFLTLVINDFSIFLNTAVIEIILFLGVISYNNKINVQKRIESQLALDKEKHKRDVLLELGTMKTNFFTNISHEFRTPLTLISGPIQNILKKENLSNKEREEFVMMQRNSNRLLSLVDQLLDISKIEAGSLKLKISQAELIPFLGSLTDSFTYLAKQKKIHFVIRSNPIDIPTFFDKDALEKIMINLLTNAIKYTPKEGCIQCNIEEKKGKLYIEVKNNGVTLSAEECNQIFERFYQINNNNKGVGIGLALVKELVNLHKGTITVESIPDEWTTFRVVLPIFKEAFNDNELAIQSTDKQSVNLSKAFDSSNKPLNQDNPILLIVDDNADIRTYVSTIFNDGYTILTAKNGKEGIDMAIEHIPDIVISDIMMPVKDGIELCNSLKIDERTSHIPIILLTAKVGEKNKIKGVKTGADDYITKPFSENLLYLRVEKLIENRKKLQKRYSQEVILRPKDVAISSIDEQFLERLQKVLDEKLLESSFKIDNFSRALGMSRMQLHRKLKALTGLSATEFIRSQRLKLAAQLLKKSEINVSQVGYSVGFNDHAYFSKCFKEAYHCTPTEYANRQ